MGSEQQGLILKKPTTEIGDTYSFSVSNITLNSIRDAYLNFDWGRNDISLNEIGCIVETFRLWSSSPTFIVLGKLSEGTLCFVRGAKRGNHVYRKRIDNRIDNLMAQLDVMGIDDFLVRREGGKYFTNAIFVTNTWDSTRFSNRCKAWGDDISQQWNHFKANLRHKQRLGSLWVFRVLESTRRGYPHPHSIIFFENKREVYRQYSKKAGRYVWRLVDKSIIDECWHSYTDVQAVSTIKELDNYLRKDLTKQIRMKSSQGVMSLAMNWFFKKRSYAVSEGFDLIKVCITKIEPIQEQIKEKEKSDYVLLGFVKFSAYKGLDPPDELEVPMDSALLRQLRSVISSPTEIFENLCLQILDGVDIDVFPDCSAVQTTCNEYVGVLSM